LDRITSDHIQTWLVYLKSNFSKYTRDTYHAALRDYMWWCRRKYKKVVFPDWKMIQLWLDSLAERGKSEMTRHTYYRALKNFLKFHDMDDVVSEFEKKGAVPRFRITRTEVLSRSQVEELIRRADSLKLKLIIRLMFILGLRVSELCSLKEKYYDPEKKTLKVVSKKKRGGITYHTYQLDDETAEMLEAWLKKKPKSEWLFPGRDPNYPIAPRTVREKLYRLGIIVLGRKVYPHMIRHSIGTLLAKEGVPAQFIAIHLRDTIRSTERYIHLSPEEVSRMILRVLFKRKEE